VQVTDLSNLAAIVLFSGPGGVSHGLGLAGVGKSVGVENDPTAVQTATAAGFMVEEADVTTIDPTSLAHKYHIGPSDYLLLQSSPPCQGLSKAGKGVGREDLDKLLAAIHSVAFDGVEDIAGAIEHLWEICSDERSPLTFETVRWIKDLQPDYVMLEQVPAALPIWEAIAELLQVWGYSTWTGMVQAEQFGVPQTRKRAILLASREGEVEAPVPTHSKYHNRTPDRLDEGVLPWVSMAEALGWGVEDLIGFGRKADGRDVIEINGQEYRARDFRTADLPSFVVTEKARSWMRYTHMGDVYNSNGCIRQVNEPAPTITASMDNGNFQWINPEAVAEKVQERINNQSGTKFDLTWPINRPAPTVAGREIVTMPGANANRFNGSTKSRNDGVRVTVEEAGVLQSFPEDYPWQGTKTKKHEQVGNAVPPLLACQLVTSLCASESKSNKEEEVA
jgi:DNA (cytosine-5)-methyltransferase 1